MDLAPGLFEGVHVLTDPAYNVAYWNLHGRRVTVDGRPRVNGRSLVFFHFSGIEPKDMERVSKHQNRFTLSELPAVKKLFVDYQQLLLAHGLRDAAKWSWAYTRFDHAVRIPATARSLYRSLKT